MKIIYIFLLGIVCVSCSSIGNYELTGVLPENSKVTEVYLLTQEGKGADTLARGQYVKRESGEVFALSRYGETGRTNLFLPGRRELSVGEDGR